MDAELVSLLAACERDPTSVDAYVALLRAAAAMPCARCRGESIVGGNLALKSCAMCNGAGLVGPARAVADLLAAAEEEWPWPWRRGSGHIVACAFPPPPGTNDNDGPPVAIEFEVAGIRFNVAPTGDVGENTGRLRYRVECLTCSVVVHENTTGGTTRCRQHLERRHDWKAERVPVLPALRMLEPGCTPPYPPQHGCVACEELLVRRGLMPPNLHGEPASDAWAQRDAALLRRVVDAVDALLTAICRVFPGPLSSPWPRRSL